ncbi:MAG TPA: alpha/beta hydrolase fold domain-containing protein [Steroidobacteraceae bacterium]|jgi:acetyl esterase/lipase|nr:alpha/beta hydrolase fold domain-containing protein [Steroidobacteraceae bacterium]
MRERVISTLAAILCVLCAAPSHAEPVKAEIAPDGTVTVPSFKLPPSIYLSDAAKKALPRKAEDDGGTWWAQTASQHKAAEVRARIVKDSASHVAKLRDTYSVRIEETTIAGIHAYRVIPAHSRPGTILINLPGGGFLLGNAGGNGLMESIPVAGLSRIEVISIDYRQAPEATFPAASEDVAGVYRQLLKRYRPRGIGIFGCSAGGLLTAQSLAWFEEEHLPMPGAAGIFCASADARWGGDSWNWQKPLEGFATAPSLDERFYYGNHDLSDPLISPIESPKILSRFPPTLLITATRAAELSSAVTTHRLLVKAGVDADLNVWDGLGHGFFYDSDLPESREAFQVMTNFFVKHLH